MRIRKMKRLLEFCKGDSTPAENPLPPKIPIVEENSKQNAKLVCVHPLASDDLILPKEEEFRLMEKEQVNVVMDDQETDLWEPDKVKKEPVQQFLTPRTRQRKQHRRKHKEEMEVPMRGVYYKNMKWQAAIKVEKKQIHLGTVKSQKEAAHLYDRAAYMRGREPNFQLSEEEKQELSKLSWEDFLMRIRDDIANKRHLRRVSAGARMNVAPKSPGNWEDELSVEASSLSDYTSDE